MAPPPLLYIQIAANSSYENDIVCFELEKVFIRPYYFSNFYPSENEKVS